MPPYTKTERISHFSLLCVKMAPLLWSSCGLCWDHLSCGEAEVLCWIHGPNLSKVQHLRLYWISWKWIYNHLSIEISLAAPQAIYLESGSSASCCWCALWVSSTICCCVTSAATTRSMWKPSPAPHLLCSSFLSSAAPKDAVLGVCSCPRSCTDLNKSFWKSAWVFFRVVLSVHSPTPTAQRGDLGPGSSSGRLVLATDSSKDEEAEILKNQAGQLHFLFKYVWPASFLASIEEKKKVK